MSALIEACNESLSLIAAGDIADLEEPSIEARECARFSGPLLLEMGEWTEIPRKVKRVVLASVENDRPAEWLHCYALPADFSKPIALRGVDDDADDLPEFGPFQLPAQDGFPLRFIAEGGRVYCNTDVATLAYTSGTIGIEDLSPLLRAAFVVELAARLAMPVKKDLKLAQAMKQQARLAKLEALSTEENKSPRMATRYVSEAEYARMGFDV